MAVNSTQIRDKIRVSWGELWMEEFGFDPSSLTDREMEILYYMARGYLNKQIAQNAGICEQTTKNHVSSILHKLDASNRTEAVMKATRWGVIPLNLGTFWSK